MRSAEHYELGHVPGAINISWKNLYKDDELAKLDMDESIIDYCYTGHTGQVGMVALGMMGYDVVNMKYGMMGWTDDADILGMGVFDCNPPNYDTETTVNEASADFEIPLLTPVLRLPKKSPRHSIRHTSNPSANRLSAPAKSSHYRRSVQAANYTIISVRSAEHYELGHVPGAINIPWKTIAAEENLKKIDPEKPVIVYCYTGHTGQVATTLLNLLGYEAINMKYGMMGWTDDAAILGMGVFECNAPNYPTEGTLFERKELAKRADEWLNSLAKPTIGAAEVKAIVDDPVQAANYTSCPCVALTITTSVMFPVPLTFLEKPVYGRQSCQLSLDDSIIDYCYTGHTGAVGMTFLGIMGYDVINMKYGMMGWTSDAAVLAITGFDCNPPGYDTETAENTAVAEFDIPLLDTGFDTAALIAKAQYEAYIGSERKPTITASEVKAIIDDPVQAANYNIISVRGADHYALGHVPGAINIPWKSIAKEENLAKIDPEKSTIVYCYTGHTGQMAATVLNLLGYEAVNMKYGMMGWTDDATFWQSPHLIATLLTMIRKLRRYGNAYYHSRFFIKVTGPLGPSLFFMPESR